MCEPLGNEIFHRVCTKVWRRRFAYRSNPTTHTFVIIITCFIIRGSSTRISFYFFLNFKKNIIKFFFQNEIFIQRSQHLRSIYWLKLYCEMILEQSKKYYNISPINGVGRGWKSKKI